MMNRRGMLQWMASGLGLSALPLAFHPAALAQEPSKSQPIPYGSALYLPDLLHDPKLGQIIRHYCQRITPVSEMKWDMLRPSRTEFDFNAADQIANFARKAQINMHGHPLIWYAANADWVSERASAQETLATMEHHIATVVGRYKDVARSWDVVNEPIPDDPRRESDRREAWYNQAGLDAVTQAFQFAHTADPSALLILNEYDVEFAIERSPMKLKAYRNLILQLLDQGAPIGGIGLQGHLRGNWPIAKDELSRFCTEMQALGLKILVTELDVIDHELPDDARLRDQAILTQVGDFLSAASAGGPLHSITTWGISDQYTWIRWAYQRSDGSQNRPLPLDWDFKEKPLMALINSFRK
jgi:endo-1,4-beta-xylanase